MSIHERPAPINRTGAGDPERERLFRAIDAAIARSRLTTFALESVCTAVRHRKVTPEGTHSWLRDEGLEKYVQRYLRGGVS
jgi:hypothetical protein